MPSDTRTEGKLDNTLEHTQRRENSMSKYHQQKSSLGEKTQKKLNKDEKEEGFKKWKCPGSFSP